MESQMPVPAIATRSYWPRYSTVPPAPFGAAVNTKSPPSHKVAVPAVNVKFGAGWLQQLGTFTTDPEPQADEVVS